MEKTVLPHKIYIRLSETAREVLPELAQADRRYPQQQIDWLILREAERRGLLPKLNQHATNQA